MRLILTLILISFASQTAAQDVVYEFSTPEHELFVECDGDDGEEKSFMILQRNNFEWTVRINGSGVEPLKFNEQPGPELYFEDLTSKNPVKVKFDLRNYDAPQFIVVAMGKTETVQCRNITEQIKFFTSRIAEQSDASTAQEVAELKSKILTLNDEIERLNIAQLALDTLDEQKIQVRLNFLCAYLKERFPQEYRILTRKRIPTTAGLIIVCNTND